jgi:hypothetical protein
MQTCIVIIALAGSIASNNIPEKPKWQTDYFEARSLALKGSKPLAVFLGNGANGWEKVCRDGVDPKVVQLLQATYVCVFIDTNDPKGKTLAAQFDVTGKGLVISDRSGNSQQFHHNGDLTRADLSKALERYGDPTRRFVSTETVAQLNPPPAPAYQQNLYGPAIRLSGS